MKENISCYLIQDLLPNYIEHLTSKEADEIVSKHLECIILVFKKNEKIKGALLGLTIMILPYLYSIEKIINYYYLEEDVNWFVNIALPITCIWIGLLWLFVWGFNKIPIKVAFKISICSFICMFGAIVTNYIVQQDNTIDQIIRSNWINILTFSLIGIGSLGIGFIYGKKKDAVI